MTTAFPYPPRHVVPTSRLPASRIPAPSDNMKKQDPQQRLVGNTRSRLEVLQQQYQQKLLREREAKMIEIYQKNQQAALSKVNRQTSLRDFFKERRNLEATKGGAVPSIQHHYKNKVKQQNQFGYKSKQPVWNPARTRREPDAERKPWSGINRGNPLQPIQRQAISADDRYRQPDPDGHYETSDDLTSNHSSNPPSDLEDEDVEFKFVPKPPVQQRPGKVRQTRRTAKQDISRNDVKQFSPEDDGYYSNQQEDGGNPARESDDQPPTNFAKAKLLGKIKQKERDRIASREGTFHSDYGEKQSVADKDQPNEGEPERKNKRDVLKQQEEELMALLRQRQDELEKLKRENEEAERQEEERKRKEAQRRKRLQEERQRREEELRKLEEEEQKEPEEEGNYDDPNSSRLKEDENENDWYQNRGMEHGEDNEKEDDEDSWFQNKEKEEQNFNATYTMKQKEKQVKHEMPKKEHQSQIHDQKEAKPNEDLAFYIDAAKGSEEVSLNLTPCPNCGRKFAVERLAKHQKACSSMKKRKVLDPTKMRTQGTEMEKYADPRDRKPEPSVATRPPFITCHAADTQQQYRALAW
ncbi:uncharacterized protein LOC144870056 isoform X2 [Branchiostoma floridae x Branchiostoma japonicum]